jgi:hypothetical protein
MSVTSRWIVGSLTWLVLAPGQAAPALSAQAGPARGQERLEARIWLDRGVVPVLQQGDRVRIYYRSSHDAYATVLHVDTDGVVRLVLPSGPSDAPYVVRGGMDYRLILSEAVDWLVDEEPGVGYFFVVASEVPFDYGWLGTAVDSGRWRLAGQGIRIEQDPYVAIDGLTRLILPGSDLVEMAVDFTAYHIGQTFSYPRFLCYECHQAEDLAAGDAYLQACPTVRVVIYNDPYFYPVTRYQGTRVVFTRPPSPGLPQFAFRERSAAEPGTPLVQPRPEAAGSDRRPLSFEWGRATDAEGQMLVLLERAGIVADELGGSPADAARPFGPPRPGAPDPRVPAILGPGSGTQGDRPVLQRRATDPADPQPR